MITPLAVKSDAHPLFALATGFHDVPVPLQSRLFEQLVRLMTPMSPQSRASECISPMARN